MSRFFLRSFDREMGMCPIKMEEMLQSISMKMERYQYLSISMEMLWSIFFIFIHAPR